MFHFTGTSCPLWMKRWVCSEAWLSHLEGASVLEILSSWSIFYSCNIQLVKECLQAVGKFGEAIAHFDEVGHKVLLQESIANSLGFLSLLIISSKHHITPYGWLFPPLKCLKGFRGQEDNRAACLPGFYTSILETKKKRKEKRKTFTWCPYFLLKNSFKNFSLNVAGNTVIRWWTSDQETRRKASGHG